MHIGVLQRILCPTVAWYQDDYKMAYLLGSGDALGMRQLYFPMDP